MATTPLLTACLIVRDESATILGCLDSLRDIADEVIVYDTGSMDKTVTLARIAGATVVQGHWDDDFARARNDALTHCTGEWVLSVDADEVLGADPAALTHLLATAGRVEAFLVPIAQNAGAENYVSHSVKLFRRSAATWTGMVHERVVGIDGAALATASVPAEVLSLTHSGYANPALAHHKCRRNAAIGLVECRALNEESVPREDELVRVLLDLGRSLMGCGQAQGAADAFSAVRCMSLPHEDPRWLQATEMLIRVALTEGKVVEAGELVAQLREAGARSDYCDWLAAQALAQLGQPEIALRMLNRVTELVDSAGRVYDAGQLIEMRALVAALAGEMEAAVASMVETMAGHGRVQGRGALMLSWWGDRPESELWPQFEEFGAAHLAEIRTELAFSRAA